jgi:hypothetical protein
MKMMKTWSLPLAVPQCLVLFVRTGQRSIFYKLPSYGQLVKLSRSQTSPKCLAGNLSRLTQSNYMAQILQRPCSQPQLHLGSTLESLGKLSEPLGHRPHFLSMLLTCHVITRCSKGCNLLF